MKLRNRIFKPMIGVALVIVLISVIYTFVGVREGFKTYISENYPGLTFKVGIPWYDIIYGRYNVSVNSVNENVHFMASGYGRNSNLCFDDYHNIKLISRNESLLKLFKGKAVEKNISDAMGFYRSGDDSSTVYLSISILLSSKTNQINDIVKILRVLHENDVRSSDIVIRYDNIESKFEIRLTSSDFNLSEQEIAARVRDLSKH